MKKLLYLFSASEKLFTELSPILQQQGINKFVGIAYGKNKVFRSFDFDEIIYVSDLELDIRGGKNSLKNNISEIEKDLGITIASCIHADRHLMRKNKLIRADLANKIIDSVITLIEKHEIDIVFSANAADLISFFTEKYCNKRNIKFIYPIPSRIGDELIFANKIDNSPINYYQRFQTNLTLDKSEYERFIKDYISNKKQPSYVNSSLAFKYFTLEQLKDFFKFLYRYFGDKRSLHFTETPTKLILAKFKKIIRKIGYDQVSKTKDVSCKYFIFPLQFIPEAATLVQGNKLYDMKTIIEIISKSLPLEYKLIIKEHKVCVGRRPKKFYKEILKYHNVDLISENYDVYKLIENSSGVISISSTMGLEAMMMEKPIGVFGKNYYNHSNNVYLMHDIYKIEDKILEMINHNFDKNDLLSILKTLLDSSFSGNMHPKDYCGLNNLPNIIDYISRLEKQSA